MDKTLILQEVKIMNNNVNIKSFFLSLSELLDKGNKSISQHQLRTSYIAWKIGEELDLSKVQLNNLLIAALIHDIGALSLEDKLNIYNSKAEDIFLHSYQGWYVLQKINGFDEIANTVKFHHTSYKELGDNEILAQIINISDYIDRLISNSENFLIQKDSIIEAIMANENFHPKLKNIVLKVANPEKFWFDLDSGNMINILAQAPLCEKKLNEDLIKSLAFLVKDIVDFKSPFTVSHSNSVMYCAYTLGQALDFNEQELNDLVLSALLHDVGKLTVPTAIIMKNGALTKLEKTIMMQHPYYTYRFLKNAGYSKRIYYPAASHHEGLDGKGYPFKFDSKNLSIAEKLLAVCDIFVALVEDRPYRKGMSLEGVEKILRDLSNFKLEKEYVELILQHKTELIQGIKEMEIMYKGEFEIFKNILKTYGNN